MDLYEQALNEMLVTTYHSISRVEGLILRKLSNNDLSPSEMHMLESIGKRGGGTTVTEIAQDLKITPPSVTAMIKRLEKKGYITKDRSSEDARCVRVQLSREGKRAEIVHRYFHRKLVRAMTKDLDAQEREALISALRKMNAFMRQQMKECAIGKEEEP